MSLTSTNEFQLRHIGPRPSDQSSMLKELGFSNLEEMATQVIPANIRTKSESTIATGLTEYAALNQLKSLLNANRIYRSYIGMGYYNTITPTVIQRNILENPVWYTAYTPYQAEIAQGRLEALLNFQTMVADLTGMQIANASLLDEATAAAEAVTMAHNLSKLKCDTFFASEDLHPQTLEVLQTRAEPVGLKMIVGNPTTWDFATPVFAAILQYPNTTGDVHDYKSFADKAHAAQTLIIAATDLLALTVLTPPGEWGADIAVGNSQRFGVPMGYGGPHAAFLATKDEYKRMIPGRIVGISVDSAGKPALRLALQTREQHIRREKATSNICTAQVLLANMASMYAVYHGPEGLKRIATRVFALTETLKFGLTKLGHKVLTQNHFDTLTLELNESVQSLATLQKNSDEAQMNFRYFSKSTGSTNSKVAISLDETTSLENVLHILKVFGDKTSTKESLKPTFEKAATLSQVPQTLRRHSAFLKHEVFNSHHSETELLRYIHALQNKDLTLTHSMIPLGSCTMKLNATSELVPVSWPEISQLHPFAPLEQTKGALAMIRDLEAKLCDITGFAAVSLQPNAGSQGEYAGLLVIRKYHQSRNEGHRNVCLIPSSAHGTNPASAAMVGMKIIVVNCDEQGNVDIPDLKKKAQENSANLAALMITYPSTHGVFEEGIREICDVVHQHGGQVYMDGANMNALVGLCRPGEYGADVSHMNLHKTFAIPHGGGGPGVGPIGVAAHLKEFLPNHSVITEAGPKKGISAVSAAPFGSASILPISWMYITMMGSDGLKNATLTAILNANYIAKKLESHYPILYKGKEGLIAHECILDLRPLKKTSGIDVTDVAKRLMDYGFHAPTMSFPVAGTLMVEPTESESKAELDRFIEAMIQIRHEIDAVEKGRVAKDNNPLINSPHTIHMVTATEWNHPYSREEAAFALPWLRQNKFWPAVARIDNAYGDRNLVCSCPEVESYR